MRVQQPGHRFRSPPGKLDLQCWCRTPVTGVRAHRSYAIMTKLTSVVPQNPKWEHCVFTCQRCTIFVRFSTYANVQGAVFATRDCILPAFCFCVTIAETDVNSAVVWAVPAKAGLHGVVSCVSWTINVMNVRGDNYITAACSIHAGSSRGTSSCRQFSTRLSP